MVLDEDNDVVRRAPVADIYRTQLAVALWRAANEAAEEFITSMALNMKGIPDGLAPWPIRQCLRR